MILGFLHQESIGKSFNSRYCLILVPVVDVIKKFWRKSGKLIFPLKPKQQE